MDDLANIRVVLVEPSHPGNIGAVARAMKTMGVADLALVRPQRFPDAQATWRAAGAVDVLDAAKVFEDLDDAIADCALIAGASARQRKIPWPVADGQGTRRQDRRRGAGRASRRRCCSGAKQAA